MDFYLSIDGSKQGPYSIFKVGDLLDSGEATADTLAWHRDLEEWKPLREIAALEAVRERNQARKPASLPAPPPMLVPTAETSIPHAAEIGGSPLPQVEPVQGAPVAAKVPVRPFIRFWARMFDYTAVSVLIFQLSDMVIPHQGPDEGFSELFARYLLEMQKPEAITFARTLFLSLIGWHLIEAVLIHLIGTTPGKALFGLSVKTEAGAAVPMPASLGRSFYVYVMGVGFYQFPFIFIGMIFSFFRIQSTGKCLWDQHLKTKVEGRPLSGVRIMLAICVFFALLLLQSVKFS